MSDHPTPAPVKPGRGAWSTTGGLLPARAGEKSRTGYYRAAALGEQFVGSAGQIAGASYNEVVVTAGVRSIQAQLQQMHLPGPAIEVDGWFGPDCAAAVRVVQERNRLTVDGILGPRTMQRIVGPGIVALAQAYGIPAWCLTGIVGAESQWDPAAVGFQTPWDTGLVQINRSAHADVTVEQAANVEFAVDWAARELLRNRAQLRRVAVRGLDTWELAVAAHNSPRAARRWAETGVPGEAPNPQAYVEKVRDAGEDARR